jgi:hypothetical protein
LPTASIASASVIVGETMGKDSINRLKPRQRFNHFAFTFSLGSKEGYHKIMSEIARKTGSFPSFYPETYLLPFERSALSRIFASSPLWIRKPAASARGIGIKVINRMPPASPSKFVIQRYVMHPLLINDFKFDLRFYVAVASLDPLRIYLYGNGLVRFATSKYSENITNRKNRSAHLTNFSINKKSKDFVETNNISDDGNGSKWSHEPFWPYLASVGFDVPSIRRGIEDAFATTIAASARTLKMQRNHRVSFELFGFDVLIDTEQRISVLEVNVSPAMGAGSEIDLHVKEPLLRDLFDLVLIPAHTKMNLRTNRLMISDTSPDGAPHRQFVAVCEYEAAMLRLGAFKCIFPTVERCAELKPIFDSATPNDEMLARWLTMTDPDREAFLEAHNASFREYIGPRHQ